MYTTSPTWQPIETCIEECLRCQHACLREIVNLRKSHMDDQLTFLHVRQIVHCANLCLVTANYLRATGQAHHQLCLLCAESCLECAATCDTLPGMQTCAESCRNCSETCTTLLD